MTITIFECDHEKNTDCTKTHCGWLNNGSAVCFNTSKKEFAKLDEHGEAIVKETIDTEGG